MADLIREWVATTSLSHLLAVCAFGLAGLSAIPLLAVGLGRFIAQADRRIERMPR